METVTALQVSLGKTVTKKLSFKFSKIDMMKAIMADLLKFGAVMVLIRV